MESKHPFLDHKSKSYNEEAVDTVNTLLAGYIAAGKGKVESLQLAISKVVPLYTKKEVKTSIGEQRKVDAGKKLLLHLSNNLLKLEHLLAEHLIQVKLM